VQFKSLSDENINHPKSMFPDFTLVVQWIENSESKTVFIGGEFLDQVDKKSLEKNYHWIDGYITTKNNDARAALLKGISYIVICADHMYDYYANSLMEIPESQRVILNQVPLMRASEYRLLRTLLSPSKMSYEMFKWNFGDEKGSLEEYNQYCENYDDWMEMITHTPLDEFMQNFVPLSNQFLAMFPHLSEDSILTVMAIAKSLDASICGNSLTIQHYNPQDFTPLYQNLYWVAPILIPPMWIGERVANLDLSIWLSLCNPGNPALSNGDPALIFMQSEAMSTFNTLMTLYNTAFETVVFTDVSDNEEVYVLITIFSDKW